MQPKPMQFATEYAEVFQDQSVVEAYDLRLPYPPPTFEILLNLLPVRPVECAVLDAGCGTGIVARALALAGATVDAVDFSAAMIAKGRTLPGGDSPRLTWICSPIESATLRPAYQMITAAASLHWMDWAIVLPRFADHLAGDGYLAIIDVIRQRLPWDTESGPLFRRYSMNRDYQPYDMLSIANTLEDRGLFRLIGQEVTQPVLFRQPVGDWVEAVHAANGFSRDRMKPEDAHAFDMQFAELIQRYCADGVVEAEISGRVLWGKPLAPA